MRRKIVESAFDYSSKITSDISNENKKLWHFSSCRTKKAILFLIFVFVCILIVIHCSHFFCRQLPCSALYNNYSTINYKKREEYILKCISSNMTLTCPANYPPERDINFHSNRTCPNYFRWIHEDLKTWKDKGIEQKMVDSLNGTAHFRLIIVNGTAYVKQFKKGYQTRDVFTLWGILQFLKLYPGKVPDLDLMFYVGDTTSVKRGDFPGKLSVFAPPLFHYCGDESTFDIVFPDWTFWGWPETNVASWVRLLKDIEKGNSAQNWTVRKPIAFWKGNLLVGHRLPLMDCASVKDFNAHIEHQVWTKENRLGFKNSDVSKQCDHRYKIYIEGITWSVSEKYILACDSMTLLVEPIYYDFFTRDLIPMKHYWPITPNNLCNSIKYAVHWGNNNTRKAQEIGKAGSEYVRNIKMEHVYDYMFHLLNEYSKLLKYKPTIPDGAQELCSQTFACGPMGCPKESKCSPMGSDIPFKIESMVNGPANQGPCRLPPPFDPHILQTIEDHKDKIKQVVGMLGTSA